MGQAFRGAPLRTRLSDSCWLSRSAVIFQPSAFFIDLYRIEKEGMGVFSEVTGGRPPLFHGVTDGGPPGSVHDFIFYFYRIYCSFGVVSINGKVTFVHKDEDTKF